MTCTEAQIHGFAYVMRDGEREFLAVQTFGQSKTRAKNAMSAMNSRRAESRRLVPVRVCAVSVTLIEGQPPVDNRFVARGCEQFGSIDAHALGTTAQPGEQAP